MGVSTTHRINLSMWILIYSFSDTYYVWAACGFYKENVSLLTGARISFLGYRFLISLTVFGLFCYHCCHFVIRQDHGFGSPSEPHQLPDWLCA